MSELTHYGVLGMKWGKRRYQNKDGSLTPAGVKRYAKEGYAEDNYKEGYKTKVGKAYAKVTGSHKYDAEYDYRHNSKEANKARAEKYVADQQKAKLEKSSKISSAVKEYSKKYDDWNEAAERADELTRQANDQYKALGKNKISRVIAAAQNKTPEAKKYNKMMDEAINATDLADEKWTDVQKAYQKTGRSRVERVINNMKNDPIFKTPKDKPQPWDEKPSDKRPWDEKPSKNNSGKI